MPCPTWAPALRAVHDRSTTEPAGVPMLDVIYLVATIALFALVGLVAKGAEKLAPPAHDSAPHQPTREAAHGEGRG